MTYFSSELVAQRTGTDKFRGHKLRTGKKINRQINRVTFQAVIQLVNKKFSVPTINIKKYITYHLAVRHLCVKAQHSEQLNGV